MRALSYAIGWGVLAALVMGLGGLFLRHDFMTQQKKNAEAHARVEAQWLAQGVVDREQADLRYLNQLCKRDVIIERLGLELAAGHVDAEEVCRVEKSAGVVIGKKVRGQITLFEAKDERDLDQGEDPSACDGLPVITLPEGDWLARAREHYVLGDKEDLWLACERPVRGATLWVAVATPATELASALSDGERRALVGSGPLGPDLAEALKIPDANGRKSISFAILPHTDTNLRLELALILVVLCAFLVASSIGFVVGRRAEQHERALAAIENAAARVAQGDLVSTIDLRLGDRADQTFHTFDRMTKELRDMRVKLAEAEREAAFREVARRIAHEIKNPLLPIQISIETLRKARDKQRADFGEIFEESTRAILDEVKRLERIVREFGEFARLPKPRPGALDLAELVRDTVSLYVPEDVELSLELADGVPKVRADREQITQVLVNLVKNALEAAQGRSPVRLNIRLEKQAQGALLSVSDNGPGIEKEARERVFEPYFTTKQEGTGLGLAIVKRIMAEHQGSIEVVDSALGGACMRLSLPAYEAAEIAIHSTSRP